MLGHFLFCKVMQTYIYGLIDPRGEMLAYVGRAIDPYKRFKQHIRCDGSNKVKDEWILSLKAVGKLPMLYIFEQTDRKYESIRERFWIDKTFSFGYRLYNIAEVQPKERIISEAKPKKLHGILTSWLKGKPKSASHVDKSLFEPWPINQNEITTKERLANIQKRITESGRLSGWEMERRHAAYEKEFNETCRRLHEKSQKRQIEQAEEQAQTAKSWARQKKVLLLLCFGGIAWIAHFIYQAYLITKPF